MRDESQNVLNNCASATVLGCLAVVVCGAVILAAFAVFCAGLPHLPRQSRPATTAATERAR